MKDEAERIAAGPFRITRKWLEADQFGARIPKWARQLAFGGYREKGWSAFDQTKAGHLVATGNWGDELWLRSDGVFCCTRYPQGYSVEAAIELGRVLEGQSHAE